MDSGAIRLLKAYRNLGTEELAKRAGVSRYQAWRWERGMAGVSPQTSDRLVRVLLDTPAAAGGDRQRVGAQAVAAK